MRRRISSSTSGRKRWVWQSTINGRASGRNGAGDCTGAVSVRGADAMRGSLRRGRIVRLEA
ncbi:MAG: hypothetical protein WCO99_12210, partial [Planctomycetota bacterium]